MEEKLNFVDFNSEVEVDFIEEFDSWEDFDRLVAILSKDLNYQIVESLEGPDVKVCEFSNKKFSFWSFFSSASNSEKEFRFKLVHDDMTGNLLRIESGEGLEKLKEIAGKVEAIMKSVKK